MSSFYDLASLVMIPSGKKAGKVYSQKPLTTDGQLDFTRASTATRIGSDGNIEKTRTNNLLYSNDFSNAAWVNNGTTETSGQSGYDGTNDAWILEKSIAGGSIRQAIAYTGVGAFSIYAKAFSLDYILLYINYGTGTDSQVYFDLLNGTVGTKIAEIDAKIVNVGNGWYKCSICFNTPSATSTILIFPADSDGSTSGTSGSVYIQDAQLEQGLVATSYIETTTAAVSVGSVDNMPRLNYTPGSTSSCPSLLLEPQRTNIDPNSEYFANRPIVTNVSVTTNSTTSPENVVNATTITNNTTSGQHQLTDNTLSVTSGTDYTISLFLKYNDAQYVRLQFGGTPFGSTNWQNFDVLNGTKGSNGGGITSADASIEDYGNGWYRCIVTADATATASTGAFQIRILEDDNTSDVPSFSGTGLSAYAYGAQMEEGSYATSYIPTFGATVTRVADVCNKTGVSGLIGQTEGTLFLDFVANDDDALQIIYQVRTTGSSNVGQIDFRIQNGLLRAFGADGGSSNFTISAGAPVLGTRYKCAVRYKTNDVAFYVNGSLVGTDTSATFTVSSKDQLTLNENGGSFIPQCDVNKALLFKTGLTNDQLAELTSTDS